MTEPIRERQSHEARPSLPGAPGESITGRLESREERLHIALGAICNNNCIFCMEEDREARYVNNSAITRERALWILEQNQGAEEVCFTSGEPTTRDELPDLVSAARTFGYRRISVMTNGRRLSHFGYAVALAKRGMNRFYISIHGHTQRLHEGLTRTPASFDQTVGGLRSIARLKRHGVELHTSTVVTKRNLPHTAEIYTFLRELGVDQVVFNVMQANGRADTYFERIFPRYTDIASTFAAFARQAHEQPPQAFLVDIPLCMTEAVPDFNRGYVERYRHFDLESQADVPNPEGRRAEGAGKGLLMVLRSDLDELERIKRPECGSCLHESRCEGVWRNYVKRYGWDEFEPVTPAKAAPPAALDTAPAKGNH